MKLFQNLSAGSRHSTMSRFEVPPGIDSCADRSERRRQNYAFEPDYGSLASRFGPEVLFGGRELNAKKPHERVALGIARTFQNH